MTKNFVLIPIVLCFLTLQSACSSDTRQGGAAPAKSHRVTYHSGGLLNSPRVYALFWLPAGYHFDGNSGGDRRYINMATAFLRHVAGSRYLGVLTEYSRPGKSISSQVHVAGIFVDRSAFPHMVTARHPLFDTDLGNEFENVASGKGLGARSTHANQLFILFLPSRTYMCRFSGQKECSYQARPKTDIQCGFHTYFIDYGPLAVVTDPKGNDLCFHSGLSSEVSDPYAASAVETLAHELSESITDPFFDGWHGRTTGDEIADLCLSTEHSGTKVDLHGQRFYLGKVWTNQAGRCVSG
jgi:hypothetical protein